MARAMTVGELANIRLDKQFSNLYFWADVPPAVFTARVNQAFPAATDTVYPLDEVAQVTYNTSSGTEAAVLVGMTLYVGTTPGGNDLGMCRVRALPTGTIMYVGEESEIAWQNGAYLTVVDEFNLWPRHVNIAANVVYMDYNIAYSDQHRYTDPVPVLGPRLIPVWMPVGGSVVVNFDSSNSYCFPDGGPADTPSSISSRAWAFPGASATTGLTTDTPTATYNAVGRYRFSCTLTTNHAKTNVGYGYVIVFDGVNLSPLSQLDLRNATGSWDRGGWTARITAYGSYGQSSIVDRAHCVLFAKDWYGATEVEMGPYLHRENIIMDGWVEGESITQNPDGGSIDFTVSTAHSWMDKITGFACGLLNKSKIPADWTQWYGLTVNAAIYQLLYWQSTVIPVIDVYKMVDYTQPNSGSSTRQATELSVPGDMSLWQQLQYLETNPLFARATCDRYNILYNDIELDLLPNDFNRNVAPVVMTLLPVDWRDQATYTRYIVPPSSKVAASGISVAAPGAKANAYFMLSPGHVFKRHGKSTKQDRLLLPQSQLDSNLIAGLLLGKDNHIIDFNFDLAGNNRMVDIAPRQKVAVNIAAGDTPRGITFSGNVVIKDIQMSWLSQGENPSNFLQISWSGEAESFPENNSKGDPPGSVNTTLPPPITLPPLPVPVNPGPSAGIFAHALVQTYFGGIYYTDDFDTGSPHWQSWMSDSMGGQLKNDLGFGNTSAIQLTKNHAGFILDNALVGVWYSPAPGAGWNMIITQNDLASRVGALAHAFNVYTNGLGVNGGVDDEAIMAFSDYGSGLGSVVNPCWLQKINSGGFAGALGSQICGAGTSDQMYNRSNYWSCQFRLGPNGTYQIVYIREFFDPVFFTDTEMVVKQCNRNGGALSSTLANFGNNWWEWQGFTGRSGIYSPYSTLMYSDFFPETPGVGPIIGMRMTRNNGQSWPVLGGAREPVDWGFDANEASNVDATGQYIMQSNGLGASLGFWAQKSADGGATFQDMSSGFSPLNAGNQFECFYCGGAPQYWIAGTWYQSGDRNGRILYTPNFGLTWSDKTGDLLDLIGTNIPPMKVRMW